MLQQILKFKYKATNSDVIPRKFCITKFQQFDNLNFNIQENIHCLVL